MPTLNEIFIKSLALIDELLPSGARDPGKTADYAGKAPALADMIQKELLRSGDLYKIHEISRTPIPNLLGFITGFDIHEFKGNELIFEAPNDQFGSVKAYYFEVDAPGTIYVEDFNGTWNILATINANPTDSGFTAYKGIVTPSLGATKSRLRFEGNYYYRTINRAMFSIPFQTAPDYMPWLKIELPIDVKSIDQVITEYPERQYTKDSNYKIEWNGTRQDLYINYYYAGKIRVQYKPVPTTITSLTDNLELDDITCQLIAYGLAMNFMAAEQNEFLTRLFKDKFNILKAENYIKQPVGSIQIVDVYN